MYKVIGVRFNTEIDSAVLEKLNSVENMTEYIRSLIQKDVGLDCVERGKRGGKSKDYTGQKFGRWTVLHKDEERSTTTQPRLICQCECGTIASVLRLNLQTGKSKGCSNCKNNYRSGNSSDPRKRINGRNTDTYNSWMAIIQRCYDPRHKSYKYYGAKGIKMFPEWESDYFAFYDYVSKLDRFGEPGMTIDRIDTSKGYEPGNIQLLNRTEQNERRNGKRP